MKTSKLQRMNSAQVRLHSEQFRLMARLRGRTNAYCPKCERPVQLVSNTKAAELFKADKAELAQLAVSGVLHQLHNVRAKVMICGDSLFECFNNRKTQLLNCNEAQDFYKTANQI